jgi:hypothetical protein
MRKTLALHVALLAMPGCGPIVINIDATESGQDDEQVGDTEGTDSTGHDESDGASGPVSMDSETGLPVPTTGTTGSTGDHESSDSDSGTSGTTGEPAEVCILPTASTTWCGSQLIAAQTLGCSTSANPPACYQTVTSQYEVGDWEMVAAADCDTAIDGPECGEAIELCYLGTGPNTCHWSPEDDAQDCLALAMDYGISEEDAAQYCADMAAVWLTGCATRSAYLACDPACDLPCSHGRDCAGPEGSEVCTEPCGSCDPPLVFGEPWTTAACSGEWCALACTAAACPPLYACGDDGGCWPVS